MTSATKPVRISSEALKLLREKKHELERANDRDLCWSEIIDHVLGVKKIKGVA
jgi:hypothetical protein